MCTHARTETDAQAGACVVTPQAHTHTHTCNRAMMHKIWCSCFSLCQAPFQRRVRTIIPRHISERPSSKEASPPPRKTPGGTPRRVVQWGVPGRVSGRHRCGVLCQDQAALKFPPVRSAWCPTGGGGTHQKRPFEIIPTQMKFSVFGHNAKIPSSSLGRPKLPTLCPPADPPAHCRGSRGQDGHRLSRPPAWYQSQQ